MSLRSEKFPDERQLTDCDLEELIRRAKAGTLHGCQSPALEARRWIGYLTGRAEDLVSAAVTESRAMRPEEDRAVAECIDGVKELRALAEELEAARRKELADPRNLIPISPRY